MLKVFLASASLLLSLNVLATEPLQASGEIDLDHAQALMDQGAALRELADYEYQMAAPECYKRFLVNRCLDRIHRARLEHIRAARTLEMTGREMELAHQRQLVTERGLPQHFSEPDPTIAIPAALPPAVPEDAMREAEAIREQRQAEFERAEAQAREERQQRDAELAAERAEAEAAAAERARRTERDRERYDERLRRHDLER